MSQDELEKHYPANSDRIQRITENPSTTQASEPMEADSSSDTRKRIHTGQQSQAHQPAAGTSDTIQTNQITASDQIMPLTGTGKEIASGGASSDGQMEYVIERPHTNFGTLTNTFTKAHKFMTFGLAPNIISFPFTQLPPLPPSLVGKNYYLTSYLAEVPWHIPALYMTPAEYGLLPIGAHVDEVSIKVIYRGSTIQFETAASTTGLATLNQINDIGVAYALNKSGQGHNVNFRSFDNANTMIPTTMAKPIYGPVTGYRGMVRDYYGSQQSDGYTLFEGDIPKHHLGRQTFLYNYWAQCLLGPATPTDPNNLMNGGWPMLVDKIEQYDGKTMVNKCVAAMTYKPKMAPLNDILRTISHGLPTTANNVSISVPVNGLRTTMENSVQTQQAGVIGSQGLELTASAATQNPITTIPTGNNIFNIYTPIEKSQFCRSGPWGQMEQPHAQPSLHVGVQPTPALTTSQLLTDNATFNMWTDTRAYWEVIATMKISVRNPTALPYGSIPNVPLGDNVFMAPTNQRPNVILDARDDGATWAGLYTTSSNPLSATL